MQNRPNHVTKASSQNEFEATDGSYSINIRFFIHQNCVINKGFSSRNTTETFMCAAYMNIETLIVINKCLRCTKIPLLRHLKTMFAPTTHNTVIIRPQRRPLAGHDNLSVLSPFRIDIHVYFFY